MFVARCRINFCNPQKWRILSDFCLKTAQIRGAFSAHCPFKSHKSESYGVFYGFRLFKRNGDSVNGFRLDISRRREHRIENRSRHSHYRNGDCIIYGHGSAFAADTAFPLYMIETVRKKRHEYICARQSAYILYKLTRKHHSHIFGRCPAYRAA